MRIQPRTSGPGVEMFMLIKGHGWPSYLSFKSARRKPVRGGRWSVRRNPHNMQGNPAKRWRAWTKGTARRWSKNFKTHDEAIRYATRVARLYAEHGVNADAILRNEREKERLSH